MPRRIAGSVDTGNVGGFMSIAYDVAPLVDDARDALCARATASRHVARELEAHGTRAARRPRAARATRRRQSLGLGLGDAGDACLLCRLAAT